MVFIVAQVDIEARLVLFDESIFQNERVFFCISGEKIDVDHGGQPQPDVVAWIPSLRVILPHAVAQIFCLTNVDNASRRILHEVDARGARKALNLLTYIHGASPAQSAR